MENFRIALCIMQGGTGNLYEDAAAQGYLRDRFLLNTASFISTNYYIVLKWSSLNGVRKVYGRQQQQGTFGST